MSVFSSVFNVVQKVFNFTLVGRLIGWLSPKQQTQDPVALQNPPTIKQGQQIRIVSGPFRIEASYCVDWGDVQTQAVKAKGGKK